VRENRQENYKTDRKMVNVLSVYVTDRKIGNTLSVFLVHTEKIIYFLSGTDYFCRYFFNTQENYEKKINAPKFTAVRTSGAKRKPKKSGSAPKGKKKGPQLVRDPQFAAFALQARSRCSAALLVVASWFLH